MKDLIQIDNTTLSSRELENEEKFETICVSDQRKEFIRNVLKRIGSKNTNFLLSGSEGIGKSYTLKLFAHLLKTSESKQEIKLIYINLEHEFIDNDDIMMTKIVNIKEEFLNANIQ